MERASLISLGVPMDRFSIGDCQKKPLKDQRKRMNAMLQDYELQYCLHLDRWFEK